MERSLPHGKTPRFLAMCLLVLLLLVQCAFAQTFHLDVQNGYGDGDFVAGDTVHIWGRELAGDEIFAGWSGTSVQDAAEWHTTLVMPAAATTVAASIQNMGTIVPAHVQMMGRDTLKEVYYHFPSGYKAVVYFLHGTNGSANGWLNFTNNLQLVKEVVADNFAIVITEAEEVTRNRDLDHDGSFRWLPDSTVDYENIRIITDSLIAQGWMQPSDKQYALGMSNGGTFAVALGDSFAFDGIVTNCSPGLGLVALSSLVPTMWVMSENDGHPSVGQQGNQNAYLIYQNMLNNGGCADYRLVPESPLHRERFARIAGITVSMSGLLYDELLNHSWIDAQGNLTAPPDTIIVAIRNDTLGYPRYYSIPGAIQRTDYANELNAVYAEHQLNVEKAKKVLQFLNNPCFSTGLTAPAVQTMALWPNPAQDQLHVQAEAGNWGEWELYAADGRCMQTGHLSQGEALIDLSGLPAGFYIVKAEGVSGRFVKH